MNGHATIEIVELNDVAVGTITAGSSDDGMTVREWLDTTGVQLSACPVKADAGSRNDDTVAGCLDGLRHVLLEEVPRGCLGKTSSGSGTISRIPPPLRQIDPKAGEPEIVSIGPLHKGQPQVQEFEKLKPRSIKSFLRRTKSSLGRLAELVAAEESFARTRHSEHVAMTGADFVQMMLLDGCFVLELLLHIFRSNNAADDEVDPIFTRPDVIPILIRDLLNLENQIPYSLLQSLFDAPGLSKTIGGKGSLAALALSLFSRAYPLACLKSWGGLPCEHLLDLFYSSLSPTSRVCPSYTKEKWPSAQSVLSVTELRPSGIKFKPRRKTDSLLDISFRKRELQLLGIAIDDFMTAVPITCVPMEQCRGNTSRYMTDYVSFMHRLINRPKDVLFLHSYGIIALLSRD